MKKFWKKQLPALFLTLVMLASLAPAALAVTTATCIDGQAHRWSRWATTQEPTCNTPGTQVRNCTMSGCSAVETTPVAATGAHNYQTVSNQNGILKRECTVCHDIVTENSNTSTSNQGRNFTVSVGTTSGRYVGTDIRSKITDLFRAQTGYSSF